MNVNIGFHDRKLVGIPDREIVLCRSRWKIKKNLQKNRLASDTFLVKQKILLPQLWSFLCLIATIMDWFCTTGNRPAETMSKESRAAIGYNARIHSIHILVNCKENTFSPVLHVWISSSREKETKYFFYLNFQWFRFPFHVSVVVVASFLFTVVKNLQLPINPSHFMESVCVLCTQKCPKTK